jgi:hypothetical protein
MMTDGSRFGRITIPDADYEFQPDGHNCGIFTFLAMLEISIVHSFNWKSKSDFVQIQDDGTPDEEIYFQIKRGEWFKLYKNKDGHMRENIADSVRHQVTSLWNRILTLKWGKNISPRKPPGNFQMPNYVRENFRNYVWELGNKKQENINHFLQNFIDRDNNLSKLLKMKNDVIHNPILCCEIDEGELEVHLHENVTVEELERAGVMDLNDNSEELEGNGLEDTDKDKKPPAKPPSGKNDDAESWTRLVTTTTNHLPKKTERISHQPPRIKENQEIMMMEKKRTTTMTNNHLPNHLAKRMTEQYPVKRMVTTTTNQMPKMTKRISHQPPIKANQEMKMMAKKKTTTTTTTRNHLPKRMMEQDQVTRRVTTTRNHLPNHLLIGIINLHQVMMRTAMTMNPLNHLRNGRRQMENGQHWMSWHG